MTRKKKDWTYAFIKFATQEQRAAGQAVLQNQDVGHGKLSVKNSRPAKSNKGMTLRLYCQQGLSHDCHSVLRKPYDD